MVFIIGLLKVIGFILLFLVLLILFFLGILLFLPICYECNGNGPPYTGNAKLKWLFGLIRIKLTFGENGFDYHLHIFHKSWPETKKTKKAKVKQNKTNQNKTNQNKTNQNQEIHEESKDSNSKEETNFQDFFQKKHFSFSKKKRRNMDEQKEKHKSILKKIKEVWKQIQDEDNKALLKFGLKQLFFLLKKIKPHKIKANITFSTTDPATTGEILGALALIKWTYKNGVHIIADFTSEQYNLEGTIFIKGNIYGFYFFIVAIRFLKNKKIREMLFHRR